MCILKINAIRSLYCKSLWNNAVPIDVAVTTDFHVQVIKKDHNYSPPYFQETIQLLQDSAEMGMKYREKCYILQKRKKNLKKTVEDLQDTLKTTCQKYSNQESTMELLMATASQIPGKIFHRIGKKRKSSVNSNTESYYPALRIFALTPLLGASQQVS